MSNKRDNPWTRAEDEVLQRHYKPRGSAAVTERLMAECGTVRTMPAIRVRAAILRARQLLAGKQPTV